MPPRKSNASIASATAATPLVGDTSFDSNATIPIGPDVTPSEKKSTPKEGLGVEVGHNPVSSSTSRKSRIVTLSMSSENAIRVDLICMGYGHMNPAGPLNQTMPGGTVNPAFLQLTAPVANADQNVKSTRELRIEETAAAIASVQVFGKDIVQERDVPRNTSYADLGLPRTMIQRLAKGVLPANTQIQKDAQLAIWKSATVFVNYLASHANDNAQRLSKKTIQPKDVLDALHDLEFDSFLPRLEAELAKYHDSQCNKRNTYRKKIRDEAKEAQNKSPGSSNVAVVIDNNDPSTQTGSSSSTGNDAIVSTIDALIGRDLTTEPAAKKARRSDGTAAVAGDDEEDEDLDDDDQGLGGDGDDDVDDMIDDDEPEDEDEDEEQGDGEDMLVEDHLDDDTQLRQGQMLRDEAVEDEGDEDSD